jgi:hypothetical protein
MREFEDSSEISDEEVVQHFGAPKQVSINVIEEDDAESETA